MIDYLQYFFNPAHIFSLRPPAMSGRAALILAAVFAAFIIFGIFSNVMANKTKDGLKIKAYKKLFHAGLTMGILGYVYLFFAVEGIPIFSARFILLTWALITAVWIGFILKYLKIDVPKNREKIVAKRNFEKYLPK